MCSIFDLMFGQNTQSAPSRHRRFWYPILFLLAACWVPAAYCGSATEWNAPCGAVAVKVFANLRGRNSTIGEAARLAGTDENGRTTLQGVEDALASLGFQTVPAEVDFDQLKRVPLPVILACKPALEWHYVVLARRKRDNKTVVVNPPAPENVLSERLLSDLGWQGVALFESRQGTRIVETSAAALRTAPLLGKTRLEVGSTPGEIQAIPLHNRTGRRLRIESVRASCADCVARDDAFSYPDTLEAGESGTLRVRLNLPSSEPFYHVRIFVRSDNPARPVEFCDIIRPASFVEVSPRAVYLPAAPNGLPERRLRIVLRGMVPIDPESLQMELDFVGLAGTREVPFRSETTRKSGESHWLLCSAELPITAEDILKAASLTPQVTGNPTARLAHLKIELSDQAVGTIRIVYDARRPLITDRSQVFFGNVGPGDSPLAENILIEKGLPGVQLLVGEVRAEDDSGFLKSACDPLGPNSWRLTVRLEPRNGPDETVPYNNSIVVPYLHKGQRHILRLPVHGRMNSGQPR